MVKSDWVFCKHEVREIGDPCITANTNKNGICKLADDCITVFHSPFVRPSLCGFSRLTPIVCCPKEQIQRIGDSCLVHRTNKNGVCKAAANCNSDFGKHSQQLCANLLFMPVVCCPVKDQQSLADDKEIVETAIEPETLDNEITNESTIINKTSENGACKDSKKKISADINLIVNINIEL